MTESKEAREAREAEQDDVRARERQTGSRVKTTDQVPEGSVSPEGVPYQAPSRPHEEQDVPGLPPEVDPDVEAKLKAQADEAAARYQGRKAEVQPEPDQATKTTTK